MSKAAQFGFSAPPPLNRNTSEKSLLYERALEFMVSPPKPLDNNNQPVPSCSTQATDSASHVDIQTKPMNSNPFSSPSIPNLSWVEQQRRKESQRLSQIHDQREKIMDQHNEAIKQQEEVLHTRRMLNQTTNFSSTITSSSSISPANSTSAFPSFPSMQDFDQPSQPTPFSQPTPSAPFSQPTQSAPFSQPTQPVQPVSPQEEDMLSESDDEPENQDDLQFEEAITDLSLSVRENSTLGTEEERKSSEDFAELVSKYKKLQQNKSKTLQQVGNDTLEAIVRMGMADDA